MISKKLERKILTPRHVGYFSEEEIAARQMKRAEGRLERSGQALLLTFLVDPEDGMIIDARFRAYGPAVLIGFAETAADLTIGKYWDQVARMSASVIDSALHDRPGDESLLDNDTSLSLNLVIDALILAMEQCQDIPLPPDYVSPLPHDIEITEGGWPGFTTMTVPQKMAIIEEVVKKEIRPYIEMDGGGIEVINLLGNEVVIAYEGSCTTCHSSTGATLSYIQQLLKAKVSPDLIVTPKLDYYIPE
jgi:NifU-like protein